MHRIKGQGSSSIRGKGSTAQCSPEEEVRGVHSIGSQGSTQKKRSGKYTVYEVMGVHRIGGQGSTQYWRSGEYTV